MSTAGFLVAACSCADQWASAGALRGWQYRCVPLADCRARVSGSSGHGTADASSGVPRRVPVVSSSGPRRFLVMSLPGPVRDTSRPGHVPDRSATCPLLPTGTFDLRDGGLVHRGVEVVFDVVLLCVTIPNAAAVLPSCLSISFVCSCEQQRGLSQSFT